MSEHDISRDHVVNVLCLFCRFEQAFLNSLIGETGGSDSQSYWTALQDRNRTGEYRWLGLNDTSEPLTYTNWNRHQPGL